jgi:hypothetical protein
MISIALAEHRAAAAGEPSVADPAAWLGRLDGLGCHSRFYDAIDQFAAHGRPVPVAVAAANSVMRRYLATAERTR